MLEENVVKGALEVGMARGADFAEVFVEDRRSTSAVLDDGRVEELTSGRDRGAGIRVVVGDTTGFAHTADLSAEGLRSAAAAAAAIASSGSSRQVASFEPSGATPAAIAVQPETVSKDTKVGLLRAANDAARGRCRRG